MGQDLRPLLPKQNLMGSRFNIQATHTLKVCLLRGGDPGDIMPPPRYCSRPVTAFWVHGNSEGGSMTNGPQDTPKAAFSCD